MKTIYVSNKTSMTLESMKNITQSHSLYKTFYKKEVDVEFRCNVCDNAKVYRNAQVFGDARVY